MDWEKEGDSVNESNYTEIDKNTPLYDRSKILAERKAWEMTKNPPDGKKLELVVIIPSMVMGSLLLNHEAGSTYFGRLLMTGKLFRAPEVYFPYVDVQDVANAHLLAVDCRKNERFCVVEGTYSVLDLGKALSSEFRKYGYKCTNKPMGRCIAKSIAVFSSDMKFFIKYWGIKKTINNEKSIKFLKMKEYKPMHESIVEMGWSMIELGIVPNKTIDSKKE